MTIKARIERLEERCIDCNECIKDAGLSIPPNCPDCVVFGRKDILKSLQEELEEVWIETGNWVSGDWRFGYKMAIKDVLGYIPKE